MRMHLAPLLFAALIVSAFVGYMSPEATWTKALAYCVGFGSILGLSLIWKVLVGRATIAAVAVVTALLIATIGSLYGVSETTSAISIVQSLAYPIVLLGCLLYGFRIVVS